MEYMLPFAREAREKGMAEGREFGIKTGRKLGQAELIELQLRDRFGELPASIGQRLADADTEQLSQWGRALLNAATLDDIFSDHNGKG